ncbi:YesL family protein [Neobacillus niacini]|uniref:YesL family protein n=1 Tax=Neobacillus niacini TaxID=86668 RepID=UPI002FFEC30F
MELYGWRSKLNQLLEWSMMLAYLNFLWMAGILLGAGIAGVFPATVAMFSVMRKWIQDGDLHINVFSHFKQEYKKEFFKANLYGYLWVIVGVIIYVDLQFFRGFSSLWSLIFSFFFFILAVIYLAALLFAFPVYVQYQLSLSQYVKNSVFIALSNPIFTILVALGFYFPYLLMSKVPGLLPFFGGSLIAIVVMKLSHNLFTILEKKVCEGS